MKQNKFRSIILLGLSAMIFGCSIPGSFGEQAGYVKLNFKFPEKNGFNLKAIPVETESIEINVTGEGLTEPVKRTITRDEANSSVKIEKLPIGSKTVEVKAFDTTKKLLAQASATTQIEPAIITQLTIELKELFKKLKLNLNNYPTDGNVAYSQITPTGSAPIFKQFEGNSIELDKVPLGKVTVKVVVFGNNSLPVSLGNSSFDLAASDTQNVNLEPLKIPDKIILPDLNIIPTELIDFVKNIVINFPDNNKPVLSESDIKVSINGSQKSFSIFPPVSVCVNNGDSYKIEMNPTDSDGDKLTFFWVITGSGADGFKLVRAQETRNTISGVVDFIYSDKVNPFLNRGAIGVIISDKKSYIGPFSIPMAICK